MHANELFQFPDSLPFDTYFLPEVAPWLWVQQIKKALAEFDFSAPLPKVPAGFNIEGPVFIASGVQLPAYGSISGPAFIGPNCELRPGVYLRGNVIVGRNCVLGNSCEFKNCLLLDDVQVPHYSYVGDSVLGNKAHLGAGAISSNLRLDQAEVTLKDFDGQHHASGMRKLGALVGDSAEVGCNAVLNPGSILGKRALVAPTLSFRGTLQADKMAFGTPTVKTAPRMN
ncbi:MAG: Bifunctional protein GlmU [Opitutia bacterium UBA7350]|nr:MAG: Bifunctional protein GlmU [Opitutae bacterium UBA7350]